MGRVSPIVTFLLLVLLALPTGPAKADVIIDFDPQTVEIFNPVNYTTATSVPFDITKLSGSATVWIPVSADSVLSTFRNSFSWNATVSFERTDGGIFGFNSFEIERWEANSAVRLDSYRSGALIATTIFGNADGLGLKDLSANAGFQDIDELRIRSSSNNPGFINLDDFSFSTVPEPSTFSILAMLVGHAALTRRRVGNRVGNAKSAIRY